MTKNDIMMLANAGFTKEEILQLNSLDDQTTGTAAKPDAQGKGSVFTQLSNDIKALTSAVQLNNVNNSAQPAGAVDTADDILAKIIAPEIGD